MTLAHYSPIPFWNVQLRDSFWSQRQKDLITHSLPISYLRLKETGRIDAYLLNWAEGNAFTPHIFWDSDVAKWIESACYTLKILPDTELFDRMNSLVDSVISIQQPDGYLNVHFTAVEPFKRFTNLRDNHELYCAGHLIEAAVAHFQLTNDSKFLDAMCRYADYINSSLERSLEKDGGIVATKKLNWH